MVQNAMRNAEKYETIRINIHRYGIKRPLQTIKNMAEKGKIAIKKWSFRG